MEYDFSSSFDSCYQSADNSSNSPNIKIGCRDSCCNVVKILNTLTKSEEDEKLIIQLINQIQNPELQKEYLDKFKKNFIKDEIGKKLKSTISFLLQNFLSLELLPLEAFLERKFLVPTTTLFTTNLVTRTSSSFVIVNLF